MQTHLMITIILTLSVITLLGNESGYSQSMNTPNTLKLDDTDARPEAKIADVAWIAGHWQGEAFGGVSEEIWSPPLGGAMMGMYKVVKDDAVAFYELLIIIEESNSLGLRLKHFNADLTGWEDKDEFKSFPLVKVTRNEAFFDGITFKRLNEDSLQIFLAMEQDDGQAHEMEFKYNRVGN